MSNVCSSVNDIIIVTQPDGTHRCSRVNVRFRHEKDIANRNKKIVTVSINGRILNPKFSLNELNNNGGSGFASSCLEKVQLPHEVNDITFTIRLRRKDVQIKARIFLWCQNSRIVAVDVDGTITKSDKRGIVFPLMGVDWTRDGVCHLLSAIHKNGYKVIYLSGRPRDLAQETRDLLDGIEQDGERLPEGPVIVSPDGKRAAVVRQLSDRQDEDFKNPVLKEIQTLYPSANPFHAGIGNRPSDERTYHEVKIRCNRIYQLNSSKGGIEVKCDGEFFSDYNGLSKFVNDYFPQVQDCAAPQHSPTFAQRAKEIIQKIIRSIQDELSL